MVVVVVVVAVAIVVVVGLFGSELRLSKELSPGRRNKDTMPLEEGGWGYDTRFRTGLVTVRP